MHHCVFNCFFCYIINKSVTALFTIYLFTVINFCIIFDAWRIVTVLARLFFCSASTELISTIRVYLRESNPTYWWRAVGLSRQMQLLKGVPCSHCWFIKKRFRYLPLAAHCRCCRIYYSQINHLTADNGQWSPQSHIIFSLQFCLLPFSVSAEWSQILFLV